MADNYGTVAGYRAYWLERGVDTTVITPDDTDVLAGLVVGSEYVDGNYRGSFPGQKTGLRPQVREWPRTGAYDDKGYTIADNEIPVEAEYATYEATSRQLASPGSLRSDVTVGTSIQQATVFGAVSVTYAGVASASDAQVSIPAIDAILKPILTGSGYSSLSGLSGSSVRMQ
jgi:hypothetical protein